MTFESRERSADQGDKVFTYTWVRGSRFYRYTNADQDVILDFQRYTSGRGISHGTIEQGGDPIRANVEVSVPQLHPVAALYRVVAPVDSVVLTIREYHAGDEDDLHPVWSGRITGVRWNPENGSARINHEPTFTSLKRTGLRRNYQRLCPLVLYGKRCGVNGEAFALELEAQAVDGNMLTAPEFATTYGEHWPGGFIVYEVESGVIERRFIRSRTDDTVQLNAPAVGLVAGQGFKAYPGCDHTLDTCIDFFNNGDNNGGFPFFPKKNPFGASPVY